MIYDADGFVTMPVAVLNADGLQVSPLRALGRTELVRSSLNSNPARAPKLIWLASIKLPGIKLKTGQNPFLSALIEKAADDSQLLKMGL